MTTILLSGILIGSSQAQVALPSSVFVFIGVIEVVWTSFAIILFMKLRLEFALHVVTINRIRARISALCDDTLDEEREMWWKTPPIIRLGSAWAHRILVVMSISLLVILICFYFAAHSAPILMGEYDSLLVSIWLSILSFFLMARVLIYSSIKSSGNYHRQLQTKIQRDGIDQEIKNNMEEIIKDDTHYLNKAKKVELAGLLFVLLISLLFYYFLQYSFASRPMLLVSLSLIVVLAALSWFNKHK